MIQYPGIETFGFWKMIERGIDSVISTDLSDKQLEIEPCLIEKDIVVSHQLRLLLAAKVSFSRSTQ